MELNCCVETCKNKACTVVNGDALCNDHYLMEMQRLKEAIARAQEEDKGKKK